MIEAAKTIRTVDLTVDTKTVCIVVFRSLRDKGHTPEVHYQVTIDPEKVSPSGQFIRMGMNQGDEINGWQPISEIVIVEKLGEWKDGLPPAMKCGINALTFDFERITDDAVIEADAVPELVSGG